MKSIKGMLACGLLALISFCHAQDRHEPALQDQANSGEVRLLVVPESPGALAALAVPVLSRLSCDGQRPCLVVLPAKEDSMLDVARVISMMPAAKACVLDRRQLDTLPNALQNWSVTEIETQSALPAASVDLAKRFWGRTPKAVAAPEEDVQAVVTAAVSAALQRLPLLLIGHDGEKRMLDLMHRELGVKEVLLIDSTAREPRQRRRHRGVRVSIMDVGNTAREQIKSGAMGNRTVILTRSPDTGRQSAWAAPYLSFVRHAPIIFCPDPDPKSVEATVGDTLKQLALNPASLTILGDERAIGVHVLTLEYSITPDYQQSEDDYQEEVMGVSAEPFTLPYERQALTFAVGRIPYSDLPAAVAMLNLGFMHEERLQDRQRRVLMVATPNPDFSNLPLCETVSRVTALEFANAGIPIDEFYRFPARNTNVSAAAEEAGLIIFEGHLTDQCLLNDSCFPMSMEDPEEEFPYDYDGLPTENAQRLSAFGYLPDGLSDELQERRWSEALPGDVGYVMPPDYREYGSLTETPLQAFEGLPIVILQSCRSLDLGSIRRINTMGGVGLIGSTTNIHSASGSTFIKAFCDGAIHHNLTVGEALRDARNYFFCLQDLKTARGYTEQSKSFRAALSFRLWGDPELFLFKTPVEQPGLAAVDGVFKSVNQVLVTLPACKLNEVSTKSYCAHLFPDAEAAGLVKRSKNNPEGPRRLLPMYFLRLPVPEGFAAAGFSRVERNGMTNRTVFRVDASGRCLYLLHFPEKEKAYDQFTLEFSR